MNDTKIEWATHTWNPVTGCRHGCEYCYARRQTERFKPRATERPVVEPEECFPAGCGLYVVDGPTKLSDGDGKPVRTTPYPKGFAPTFNRHKLLEPSERTIPSRIFVTSMGDLFGEWVPDVWIDEVFDACKRAPQHTYLFLTKNPERYAELDSLEKLPTWKKNLWFGATVTNTLQMKRVCNAVERLPKRAKLFLSIEPMMENIAKSDDWWSSMSCATPPYFSWIIIGAMTGPGSKRYQPKQEWVERVVDGAQNVGVPVFMKNSLAPIWGPDLIQEFPAGMAAVGDVYKKPKVPRCQECEYASAVQQGKRGMSYSCEIGWEAEGYDDRGARHIPAAQARFSPPWCPRR